MNIGYMDDPSSGVSDFNPPVLLQACWTKQWLIELLTVSV
jgi:hypothetical protein